MGVWGNGPSYFQHACRVRLRPGRPWKNIEGHGGFRFARDRAIVGGADIRFGVSSARYPVGHPTPDKLGGLSASAHARSGERAGSRKHIPLRPSKPHENG